MQPYSALEILAHQMLEWTDFDDAGVVDQDIDFAEPIDHSANSRLNLFAIEQIALNCHYCVGPRSEIGLCTRQFLSIACNEGNIPTSRANVSRKHQSQSARSARDEDDFFAWWITYGADETND